jgi:hypothetical protein
VVCTPKLYGYEKSSVAVEPGGFTEVTIRNTLGCIVYDEVASHRPNGHAKPQRPDAYQGVWFLLARLANLACVLEEYGNIYLVYRQVVYFRFGWGPLPGLRI